MLHFLGEALMETALTGQFQTLFLATEFEKLLPLKLSSHLMLSFPFLLHPLGFFVSWVEILKNHRP